MFSFGGTNLNTTEIEKIIREILDRLRIARESIKGADGKPLKQGEFGHKVGQHANTIGRYERGETLPDIGFIINVCSIYGVSLAWLVLGLGDMFASGSEWQAVEASRSINDDCVELKKELVTERQERREVSLENRQLYKAMTDLLRENGDLRAEVANLKAQLEAKRGGEDGTEISREDRAGVKTA